MLHSSHPSKGTRTNYYFKNDFSVNILPFQSSTKGRSKKHEIAVKVFSQISFSQQIFCKQSPLLKRPIHPSCKPTRRRDMDKHNKHNRVIQTINLGWAGVVVKWSECSPSTLTIRVPVGKNENKQKAAGVDPLKKQ